MSDAMTVDFYGSDAYRFNRAGKHPGEFMSENEQFAEDDYGAVSARAAELALIWEMPVNAKENGEIVVRAEFGE